MYQYFYDLQLTIAKDAVPSPVLTAAICVAVIIAGAAVAKVICHIACAVAQRLICKHHAPNVKTALDKYKAVGRLSSVAIPVTAAALLQTLPDTARNIPDKLVGLIAVFIGLRLVISVLETVAEIYGSTKSAKRRPIKGIIQAARAAVRAIAVLAAVSVIVSKNPLALMGGIGAIAAVLSFVFKDALLGLVAGIQLTSGGSLRIGDHIKTSDGVADGNVTDISLTSVKVKNFDLTETIIPAYTLMTGAFINFRAVETAGIRRICRSLIIDPTDVRFAVIEGEEKFEEPEFEKQPTNVGALREYMEGYASQHPKIRDDMPITARVLPQTAAGLPVRLIAYAECEDLADYEQVQSELFEHFYARLPDFALSASEPVNITDTTSNSE